jgi:hypothetical protein
MGANADSPNPDDSTVFVGIVRGDDSSDFSPCTLPPHPSTFENDAETQHVAIGNRERPTLTVLGDATLAPSTAIPRCIGYGRTRRRPNRHDRCALLTSGGNSQRRKHMGTSCRECVPILVNLDHGAPVGWRKRFAFSASTRSFPVHVFPSHLLII